MPTEGGELARENAYRDLPSHGWAFAHARGSRMSGVRSRRVACAARTDRNEPNAHLLRLLRSVRDDPAQRRAGRCDPWRLRSLTASLGSNTRREAISSRDVDA